MSSRMRVFAAALLTLLIVASQADAAAFEKVKIADLAIEEPGFGEKTSTTGSDCIWWNYACDIYYYGYVPSTGDGDMFAQRFPCEVASSLKTIRMVLYKNFPEFSDVSGLGIDLIVWDDDGFGLPGTERTRFRVPSSQLVYSPAVFSIDVQAANLVFENDFHIGYTTVDQANDAYGILLDDGTCGYEGSSCRIMGIWETILDHFAEDINFLISAEVCGQTEFVARFTTPEGAPHPFDVTLSDGESIQKFENVDSVAASVSPDFTLRLDYQVDSHFVMGDWELSLQPCKRTEFEFYAVNPNTVSARTQAYLFGKEVGTEVDLQWNYSAMDTTLTYTVATVPLGKYVFAAAWIYASSAKSVPDDWVAGDHSRIDFCPNGEDRIEYYTGSRLDSTRTTTWLASVINIPSDDDDSSAIVSHEFHRISGDLTAVGIRKAIDSHVRVPGYDVALVTPDLQSHAPDYFYPQWALQPNSSYCLEMVSESPGHASLTYPLLIPDSTNGLIFDPYLPPVAELTPYDFRIAGENTFAHSSYSDLAYDPGDSITVDVSTDMSCDYWGCFILPEGQDFAGLAAYSATGTAKPLEYFTDWFEQEESGFKLITVRVEPSYRRIKLAFVAIWASISGAKFRDADHDCVWGFGENALQGFQINLSGPVSTSVFTNSQGEYAFTELPSGTYSVWETVQAPWVQTCPKSVIYTVSLQATDQVAGIDFGNDSCEIFEHSFKTCTDGTKDNFVGPEPSYSSPDLLAHMQAHCYDYQPNFDSPTDNQCFGHTFENCWDTKCLVVGAELCFKLRASGGISGNDTFGIVYCDGSSCGGIWAISISNLEQYCNPGSGPWQYGDVLECCIDLENLPFSPNYPTTNILANLQDGNLDILIQDDTEVDYMELNVELCCPPPDTGACCACDSTNQVYCFYTDRQTCRDKNGTFHPGLTCSQVQCDTCYACGDVNGDGICLTVSDLAYLFKFLFCGGPEPHPLCQADLNCDGVVDADDYHVFKNYFVYGLGTFPCGYPAATSPCPTTHTYLLGDADGSGFVDIDDIVYLIYYVFGGGPAPNPIEYADVDQSGFADIDDIVFLINYVFGGGPSPCDTKGLQYSGGDSGESDPYALSFDAKPFADKADGYANLTADEERDERGNIVTISLDANVEVQALQLEFEVAGDVTDVAATSLVDGVQIYSGIVGGLFKIGLLDINASAMIPAGSMDVARIYQGGSKVKLVNSIAIAKGGGELMTANHTKSIGNMSIPKEFSLQQNAPNPFNPTTEIGFSLPVDSRVKLDVFNITGQKVTTLADERMSAGQHTVTWNGRMADGEPAASGVYFYRIKAGDFTESRKMLLLK